MANLRAAAKKGSLDRVRSQGASAWAFLSKRFATTPKHREPPSWQGCQAVVDAYAEREHYRWGVVRAELQVSELDHKLEALGGDPLNDDWRDFRPLSLGREEAWSDWLAQLLATGNAEFLREVFGRDELPAAVPNVHRESVLVVDQSDRSRGYYRSDIIIKWSGPQLAIHLEVKVGDPHLEKTWAEARHLRRIYGGVWHHFLLVLPNQKPEADRTKAAAEPPNGLGPNVTVITWEDVERELRRALLRETNPRSWRGLARVFAGALGQLQLRRPFLEPSRRRE